MKYIALAIFALTILSLFAISNDDLNFLVDKEQYALALKHADSILAKAYNGNKEDVETVLSYALRSAQPGLAILCNKRLATEFSSMDAALQWLSLTQNSEVDSTSWLEEVNEIIKAFHNPLDAAVLNYYAFEGTDSDITLAIATASEYNEVVETMAKEISDEISVQPNDSLALGLIDDFYRGFPNSKYAQIAYYYQLYHLSSQKDWHKFSDVIAEKGGSNPVFSYISALYLISPTYRKMLANSAQPLIEAREYLQKALSDKEQILLYDSYSPADWQNRIKLQEVKIAYYELLSTLGCYGDEKEIPYLSKTYDKKLAELIKRLQSIQFINNDRGELSEKYYWLGRICGLDAARKTEAARNFGESLRYGSPRKKYDNEAWDAILAIHKDLKLKSTPMDWMRELMGYKGIMFEDVGAASGLSDKAYSRVALADYNADGLIDILFSGSNLYANKGSMAFEDSTVAANLANLNSNGGLFADFNKDGLLDMVSFSSAEDGNGERLMKNMDGSRFVSVNERAGDIDDKYPSEAAAWVDTDGFGYPSLYIANYEKWQKRVGYPDFFWHNDKGYFADKSASAGFLAPEYTDKPGQAGRGIAPADFDNDGKQEILVTNYRLNRNFCWKQADTLFVDVAALYGLAGTYKNGYYGHSIGADWGDFDNDGDLDLFVANLAHPRFLDISDKSMLLRNDGLTYRVVEGDSIYYWQFTNITEQAGITYDELHSDPLFFDADNDGFLDLFITSVYQNDRSYLYHNNGDGTFTDVTWLAGARVYNGWGNASGDLDRDGLVDLVVGSGNGAKILHNRTITANKAIFVKPVWEEGSIALVSDPSKFKTVPQSPAYGTRLIVKLKNAQGKEYQLIRELSSAKGTASQNVAELHFGIGNSKVLEIKRFKP
ncbi:MAG: VCBS repeat-containing protein [Candidatus Cloacimonetes bacterium]|nr:VCBS repeat-containing protein [Candidatus Cloacimonadota bacterium]